MAARAQTRNERVVELEKLLQRPRNQRKINFGRNLAKIEFGQKNTDFLVIESKSAGIKMDAGHGGEINIHSSFFAPDHSFTMDPKLDEALHRGWFLALREDDGKIFKTRNPVITGRRSWPHLDCDELAALGTPCDASRLWFGPPEAGSATMKAPASIWYDDREFGVDPDDETIPNVDLDGDGVIADGPLTADPDNPNLEFGLNISALDTTVHPDELRDINITAKKVNFDTADIQIKGDLQVEDLQVDGVLTGGSPLEIDGDVHFLDSAIGNTACIKMNGQETVPFIQFLASDGTTSKGVIQYVESGGPGGLDVLNVSGGSDGIYLAGDIYINGTLQGASPLKIAGEVQFLATGSAAAFNFGPNQEAKIFYDDSSDFLIISGSSAKGTVLSGSNIVIDSSLGVGVTAGSITHAITLPNNADSTGEILANSFITYSSERYKNNIQTIDNPMSVISNLNGVSFNWKDTGRQDYGFIAEDVGKVLPNIVSWEKNKKDAHGMDYLKIISFLVEATKEQQIQIDNLNREISLLKKEKICF